MSIDKGHPVRLLALLVPLCAHLAPNSHDNNRFAKVSLLPGTVRVSYTVYFGDQLGALFRRRMDTNANGRLDESEAQAFGAALVAEIGPAIALLLDDVRATGKWTLTDVGLGSTSVAAGSFSVDLALVVPGPTTGPHSLWLEDRWLVPNPGETNVRIEGAPGITILLSHARRDGRGISRELTFHGAATEPGARGILVRFAVEPTAIPVHPATNVTARRRSPWFAVGVLTAAAVAAVSAFVVRRAKPRQRS